MMSKISVIPQKAYFDTNYLIFLSTYSAFKTKKLKNCKDIYDKLANNSCELITSILAVEEMIYNNMYNKRIIPDCINHFKSLGNRERDFNFKIFKDQYRGAYTTIYNSNINVPVGIYDFIKNWGIKIVFPKLSYKNVETSSIISKYAITIMKNFPDLEPMDAFHIAIGRRCGIDTFITNDKSYKVFSSIISVIDPIKDKF